MCTLGIELAAPADAVEQPCPNANAQPCTRSLNPYACYTPVHLWCAEDFPLTVQELRWLLEYDFPHMPLPWKPVPNIWFTDALGDTRAGEFCTSHSRLSSKGVLPCNRWLERQLLHLDPTADVQHLYPEWLQRYNAQKDVPLTDPVRSFQRAVESARKRIAKRSGRAEE